MNFTNEQVPDWLRPLLISQVWVEEKKRKWGEHSPLYISKVLGEFPEQSTDSLIPLSALKAAATRDQAYGAGGDDKELGVDVARFGDDFTVIYFRHGHVCRRVSKVNNRDLMHVCGMVVQALVATGATKVKVDDIGLGGGVTDRLHELQRDPRGPGAQPSKAVMTSARARSPRALSHGGFPFMIHATLSPCRSRRPRTRSRASSGVK